MTSGFQVICAESGSVIVLTGSASVVSNGLCVGSSGTSGSSGSSGTSGTSGSSGSSGTSGSSGSSGTSGSSGSSGTSGVANIINNAEGRILTATGTQGEAYAESNLVSDGTNLFMSSYSGGSVNSNTTLITIPTTSGYSGFFDYYVSDGTNSRAGTVMSVWNNSNSQFTDYSTSDLGGPTTGITFSTSVINAGSDVVLQAIVGSGTWTVKVGARIIF
jgi:hypothetical protein